MEQSIKCGLCKHENNKRCSIKNVKVKLNKKRRCNKFSFDETKDKVKGPPPVTTRVSYIEAENKRKEAKKKLKELRKQIQRERNTEEPVTKTNYVDPNRLVSYNTNSKHPLTGDLSRFMSTAVEKDD
jgi:hypothetical protein